MQSFLQLRLGYHGLPIAAGHFDGAAQHEAVLVIVVLWGIRST